MFSPWIHCVGSHQWFDKFLFLDFFAFLLKKLFGKKILGVSCFIKKKPHFRSNFQVSLSGEPKCVVQRTIKGNDWHFFEPRSVHVSWPRVVVVPKKRGRKSLLVFDVSKDFEIVGWLPNDCNDKKGIFGIPVPTFLYHKYFFHLNILLIWKFLKQWYW